MRLRHPYSLDDDAPPVDGAVHYGGRRDVAEVDDDGTFAVPDDRAEAFVDNWPTAEGYDLDDLRVDPDDSDGEDGSGGHLIDTSGNSDVEYLQVDPDAADDVAPGEAVCTCDPGDLCERCGGNCPTVKSDGEVCGRGRPCRYHDDEEGN